MSNTEVLALLCVVMAFVLVLTLVLIGRSIHPAAVGRSSRTTPRQKTPRPTLDDFFASDEDDEARRRILGS